MPIIIGFIAFIIAFNGYSWNAMGHRLIAQIAYDNLTESAKERFSHYLFNSSHKTQNNNNFVYAATWMDVLKSKGNHSFDTLHYVPIPYSKDGTPLPAIPQRNALWAIEQAISGLKSNSSRPRHPERVFLREGSPNYVHDSKVSKQINLRILIHVVGDIHQPLHTCNRFSSQHPKGDYGGNLFRLGKNPIASNLHQYWDRGGGLLRGRNSFAKIRKKAHSLESKWSCKEIMTEDGPQDWIKESHHLAITYAYQINPKEVPNLEYETKTKSITEKQLVTAGCRLAGLLNKE